MAREIKTLEISYYLMEIISIFLKSINKSNEEELILISSSNLSPANVTVNVIGEVLKPGSFIKVKANISLMQSILVAGGFKQKQLKKVHICYSFK